MTGIISNAIGTLNSLGTNILREGETVANATLELNFDPSQMFSYTNVITNSMMPLVYISAGFALGFTIIYSLKNAFSGRL